MLEKKQTTTTTQPYWRSLQYKQTLLAPEYTKSGGLPWRARVCKDPSSFTYLQYIFSHRLQGHYISLYNCMEKYKIYTIQIF